MRNRFTCSNLHLYWKPLYWKPISQQTRMRPIIVGELIAWIFNYIEILQPRETERCLKLQHSTWNGFLFAIIITGIIGILLYDRVLRWSNVEYRLSKSLNSGKPKEFAGSCIEYKIRNHTTFYLKAYNLEIMKNNLKFFIVQ